MKKIISLFLLIGFVFVISCASEKSSSLDKEEIIVGMELQYPPFETIDKDGKPYGISVDFANELGKYLGKKVKIEEISYSGLIPALLSKKIDLIISSMTITEARKEQIDFSEPYASAYLSLLIYKDSKVNTPEDLNNKDVVIAVKKGTSGQLLAESIFTNAKILVFDKDSEAVLEVSQGKADSFIYDVYSIFKNNQQYPNTTRVYLKPVSEKDSGYWGVGLRKNDTELKEKVNSFIVEYATNSSRDMIVDKHLKDIKETFDKEGLPFFF